MTPVSGVDAPGEHCYGIQLALNGAFWAYYPDQKPPRIDWGPSNDLYQSGAIRFSIDVGGKPTPMTTVVIEPKSAAGLWTITAGGSGDDAAKLADQTARGFVFR
jgi:hypothetical protein